MITAAMVSPVLSHYQCVIDRQHDTRPKRPKTWTTANVFKGKKMQRTHRLQSILLRLACTWSFVLAALFLFFFFCFTFSVSRNKTRSFARHNTSKRLWNEIFDTFVSAVWRNRLKLADTHTYTCGQAALRLICTIFVCLAALTSMHFYETRSFFPFSIESNANWLGLNWAVARAPHHVHKNR